MEHIVMDRDRLYQRLTSYTAAAGALIALGTSTARAQVNYSGEQNLVIDLTNSYLELDLDGDLVKDFGMYFDSYGGTFTYNSLVLKYVNRFGAMINLRTDSYKNSWITTLSTLFSSTSGGVVTSQYIEPVVAKIAEEDTINSLVSGWGNVSYIDFPGLLGASVIYTVEGPIFTFSSADSRGQFPSDSGFVGVRFYIGSERHYGWIRVHLSEDMKSMTIVDWAWETNPNTAVVAGATQPVTLSGGGMNPDPRLIRIYPNPVQDILYIELDAASDIQLFNAEGRMVYSRQKVDNETLSVEDFPRGIYLLRIHNQKGKFTRKLILR